LRQADPSAGLAARPAEEAAGRPSALTAGAGGTKLIVEARKIAFAAIELTWRAMD
jgi:hypothetical protein